MDEWNRHCRSGRQCGSAIQGLDRIWVRYPTDWVRSATNVAVAKSKGYGKLFHRPAAADAEIVSAVHAAADCDLAVRVEGQGSMLLVHTFQQYRAFIFRQETGVHRLMHNLAVGIDVGCEGRVAKSERHHADFGEMYRHAV